MIVAERKHLKEIQGLVSDQDRILIVGCQECVTVCMAGGEREVGILASSLRLARSREGKPVEILEQTIHRQCDFEFVDELKDKVEGVDCIISMACGVGVQFVAERYVDRWVVPALNTKFAGGTKEIGLWEERCGLCGECILYLTGGVCPIARCSKSLLNGPCGGSQKGKCEVSEDIDCGWQLIYDRLQEKGRLDLLFEFQPPKDWSVARDGGPRKVVREDVML